MCLTLIHQETVVEILQQYKIPYRVNDVNDKELNEPTERIVEVHIITGISNCILITTGTAS